MILLLLLSIVTAAGGSDNNNNNSPDYDIVGPSSAGFLPSHALRFSEHPDAVVALPGDEVFFNCKTAGGKG